MNPVDNEQPVLVTAGIIVREGRILICQRHHTDSYGLQWEFPGGKVDDGERPSESLRRELTEELGITAEIGEEFYRVRHRYPDRFVEVVFFHVPAFHGEVRNQVFETVAWVSPGHLPNYPFLQADREIVQRIAHGEIV